MSNDHRRMVGSIGMAAAGLLAPPLIALLASPLASADTTDLVVLPDPITTYGPFTFDGYTDTFSFNDSTFAFDNYLTGTVDGSVFNLDTYFGAPGSGSSEVLLTDPGVFQLGVDYVDGSVRYIDNFLGTDFLPTDPGLALLGGL